MLRQWILLAGALFMSHTAAADDVVPDVAPITVNVMKLEESGQVSPINVDDVVKWLRESIADGQNRLATELPASLGTGKMEIQLVSVPHPDVGTPENKLFLQWKHELNPATFIPFVGRAVEQKVDFFVALEARVLIPGRPVLVFPGQSRAQAEYRRGLRLTSAFLETQETVGKKLFEEAIDKAIAALKVSAIVNQKSGG